jgi:hypothetical protein
VGGVGRKAREGGKEGYAGFLEKKNIISYYLFILHSQQFVPDATA